MVAFALCASGAGEERVGEESDRAAHQQKDYLDQWGCWELPQRVSRRSRPPEEGLLADAQDLLGGMDPIMQLMASSSAGQLQAGGSSGACPT